MTPISNTQLHQAFLFKDNNVTKNQMFFLTFALIPIFGSKKLVTTGFVSTCKFNPTILQNKVF